MNNHPFYIKLIHCGNRNIANPEDNLEKSIFFIPMGLFALAKRVQENGFDVEIIHSDLETHQNIEEILDFNRLDAVGFDCHWGNQSLVVMNAAELIKKIKPAVFVFLGGFTASFFAKEILCQHPYIDAIIRGDAEVPLVELCRALRLRNSDRDNNFHFKNIPNLVWKGNNNQLEFNEFSYVASNEDLDNLDFAHMTLLRNWDIYRDANRFFSMFTSLNSVPQFLLSIGRGCIYACSFCGGNNQAQQCINNRKGQSVRSIDSVVYTIKKAVSFGFTLFMVDFNFENYEEYFINLFKRIKEEKLDIIFAFGCWRLPSKALIDTIAECFPEAVIQISPETAVHHLRKINKDLRLFYQNEEIEECLEYVGTKKNLKIQLFFGYFLPFDTEETIFTTLSSIEKMMFKYSHFAEFYYGNLSTDPASLLFLHPDKYEIEINLRCFSDYLALLKENYMAKSRATPDITAFKPRNMSEKTFNRLATAIGVFNALIFCFQKSTLLLFKKVARTDVISNYLREVEIPLPGKNFFAPEDIKNILLDICKKNDALDSEILTSIEGEYEVSSFPSLFKLRQFYSYKSNEKELSMEKEENEFTFHSTGYTGIDIDIDELEEELSDID